MERGRFVTEAHVQAELERLSDRLEAMTTDYAHQAVVAAEAEATHKALRARVTLLVKGTRKCSMAEAEAHAEQDDDVAEAHLARLTSNAQADALREGMRSTRAQMDALRTLMATYRVQTN